MANKQLIEADTSSLFDAGLSEKELFERKTALARVLKKVNEAVDAAESAGNTELAAQLQEKADHLQELLDTAEDVDYTPGGDGDGEPGDPVDPDDHREPGEPPEPKEPKKPGKPDKPEKPTDPDEPPEPKDPPPPPTDPKDPPPPGKSKKKSPLPPPPPTEPPTDPKGPPPPPPPDDDPFEIAKSILGGLTSGDARKGAAQGLKDLLSKRGISFGESLKSNLNEALTKTVSQMTADEFNDELAKAMELVDKVLEVSYSDDLEDRVKEIKRDSLSRTARMELEKEDSDYVSADKKAMKAFDGENERMKKYKPLAGMDAFKNSLYRAISDQVAEYEDEEDSWAALDRRHEDDPSILKKGIILDDKYDGDLPTVNVYFDQSGSWGNSEIEIGMRAISVINEFHERNEIKLNIFYMSAGGIFTTPEAARAEGGAEGWYDALHHIRDSKVKNVVVLSDSDLDSYEWNNRPTGDNGKTYVDGCVWWLWKNGRVSRKAPLELMGRTADFHYNLKV